MPMQNLNLIQGYFKAGSKKRYDRPIRFPAAWRFRNCDFQRIAKLADDPIARCAWDHFHRELQPTCMRCDANHSNRFTIIVSFCPPNPKLLDSATSTFAGRALLGT